MGCGSCLCSLLAWMFAIVANVAALVSLGMAIREWGSWQGALGGSVAYLFVLLIATRRYHSKAIAKATEASTAIREAEAGASMAEHSGAQDDSTDEPPETSMEATTAAVGPSSSSRLKKQQRLRLPIPFGLSMMYLLTNLVLALPGAIVIFYAFPCSTPEVGEFRRQVYWKTNVTELPDSVQTWMANFKAEEGGATFAETSSAMYIYGSFHAQEPEQLYTVQEVGVDPQILGNYKNIHDIVAVSETDVCFFSGYESQSTIFCGNEHTGFKNRTTKDKFAFGLEGIDGVLWFLQISHDYFVFHPLGSCNYNRLVFCHSCNFDACGASTMKVMSLDVSTMELVSHSRKYATRLKSRHLQALDSDPATGADNSTTVAQEPTYPPAEDGEEDTDVDEEDDEGGYYDDDDNYDEGGEEASDEQTSDPDNGKVDYGQNTDEEEATEEDESCDGQMTSFRAFAAIFVSALPSVLNSARVWVRYAIPSSSVTLFLGLGYGVFCVFGFFDNQDAATGFALWLKLGTPVWTLVCTYQLVVNPRVTKEPLWWSLYGITTGLICALAYQSVLQVDAHAIRAFDGNELVMWILDFFFVHFPLLIIAILTKSVYISLLTLVGFLILTTAMIWQLLDDMSDRYMYGGIAYGATLVLALILYCLRETLHGVFFGWLSSCARHTCAIEVEDDEEDDENTAGLLLNENAEHA